MPRRHLAVGAALLLLPLAGCGEKKIKSSDLEAKLKTQLGKDLGVEAKSVSCPDDITVKKGKKFNCTMIGPSGDKIPVVVTLTNDKGGFTAQVPAQ